ncbi:MAG: hypothetical protein KBD15_03400 [Candidatus Magasanikbacteria bacterium]|nr:hypothetical protein [Candidatus Magasanikbacteria bacterium]
MLTHAQKVSGGVRLLLGGIFFWAYIDKVFGFGFGTLSEKSWLRGVSPTQDFLLYGTHGLFAGVFQSLAGNTLVDWVFMTGLLCIGVSLLLGIGMRLSAFFGSVLLCLMWLSAFPPKNNPLIDQHVIYIGVLWWLFFADAGRYAGLGTWWARQKLVKRFPWLA